MSPETEALIFKMMARKKDFSVVTRFADGTERRHDVATTGQAENYAVGERRNIGKKLISRATGETVCVIAVDVVRI